MFRWALCAVLASYGAGCTRLNGAFSDDQGDTGDGSTRGADAGTGSDSTLGRDDTSTSTSQASSMSEAPLTTQDPTDSDTSDGDTDEETCFTVHTNDCDLFDRDTCRAGNCRPFGNSEGFMGIGCVEQPPHIDATLEVGAECTHECPGLFGADACPSGSICDPFSDDPHCLQLCDPADATCAPETRCFVHEAGPKRVGLCHSTECSPLGDPIGCQNGHGCVPGGDTGFVCLPAEGLAEGALCNMLDSCEVGLMCAPSQDNPTCPKSTTACCTAYCSVALNDCGDGLVCDEVLLGVGVCVFE